MPPRATRLQPRRKSLLAGDVDDIFAEIESGFRQKLDVGVAGQNQRPFEFQHQGTRRNERDDVIALLDPGTHRLSDDLGRFRDLRDIALLQHRHAAAMRMQNLRFDPVLRQHGARREPNVRARCSSGKQVA